MIFPILIAPLAVHEANTALKTRRARAAGAVGALAIAGLAFAALTLLDSRRTTRLSRQR